MKEIINSSVIAALILFAHVAKSQLIPLAVWDYSVVPYSTVTYTDPGYVSSASALMGALAHNTSLNSSVSPFSPAPNNNGIVITPSASLNVGTFMLTLSAPLDASQIYFFLDTSLLSGSATIDLTGLSSQTFSPTSPWGRTQFSLSSLGYSGLISSALISVDKNGTGGVAIDYTGFGLIPEPATLTCVCLCLLALYVIVARNKNKSFLNASNPKNTS